jgi:phosphatidylinositol alpha-1,6-mannosyltransferase
MSDRPCLGSVPRRARPRLALLTFDFPPQVGGVQQYLFEIAQRLEAHGYKVLVLTSSLGPLPDHTRFERILLPTTAPCSYVRQVRRLRPDRVVVGHAHPRLLLAAALAAWGRYGVISHGNDFLCAQDRWHRPVFNWLLRHSRPLIVNSQANACRLDNLGVAGPVVVHPGTEPSRFTPNTFSAHARTILLTVGRLVRRKGFDTVLQVLPSLRAEFPDLRYRIVGDGPDRGFLEQMARDLNLSDTVEFSGRVSDDALPDIYRRSDIFVMPAREETGSASIEGFGIVYLEASASGLPVVAARSGGAVEAVRDGETGFLVPPDDPEALTRVLRELVLDAARRHSMGQAGRRWVEEEMNWDRAAAEIARLLADQESVDE